MLVGRKGEGKEEERIMRKTSRWEVVGGGEQEAGLEGQEIFTGKCNLEPISLSSHM